MVRSLYGRIALVFASIVLTLGGMLIWLGYSTAKVQQHEVLQRVSLGLAANIAKQIDGTVDAGSGGLRTDALLRDVLTSNPNVEVYLLDRDGRILLAAPNGDQLARDQISLTPIRELLSGAALPLRGDDPQDLSRREIFSAAPVSKSDDGSIVGYVYIVLLNDMYREMVTQSLRGYVLSSSAKVAGIAIVLALSAGLAVFSAITRRLHRLTREVEAFAEASAALDDSPQPVLMRNIDEIGRLSDAFALMRQRLQSQMVELKRQDELRRELVANVSHDLRTPLTSMQGYLETLIRLGDELSPDQQRQYLDVAIRQSRKVSKLVQQLFELARLDCEETLPQAELFSISELMQDIAQKYALTAKQKNLSLQTHVNAESLLVHGDIGLIERVIGNLLDNAIRHTPTGGSISLEARTGTQGIEVCVTDNGQGIAAELLPGLLERGSPLRLIAARRGGGLGLLIANRILDLHGSRIRAASRVGYGTRISFVLPPRKVA